MLKKKDFEAPWIGIEMIDSIPVFYNRRGDYSVCIRCENPIMQFAANTDAFYDFHNLFSNIIKTLGAGYIIQKQDIFCKEAFHSNNLNATDYLSKRYFEHFENRIFTSISTYITITRQLQRSKFFAWDSKEFSTFLRNITKVLSLLNSKDMGAKLLQPKELEEYMIRVISCNFNSQKLSLKNIKTTSEYINIGEKKLQSISLVDIDEVNLPTIIKPYKEINVGVKLPVDLLSFIYDSPEIETIIYNQIIEIPDQRNESNKLEAKKRRHKSMPDPANDLCVEDIDKVQSDIAREGKILVYAHYNIMLANQQDITKASNYIESSLFDCGIIPNKQCYNQFELFKCALPGCATELKSYDKFLTTSDAAICFFFKERLALTEKSPFLTYYTDRQGIPIGIDFSGKEGDIKYTNNSNVFVLGPSGSGKSFFVNDTIRQWVNQDTDIVMVDTGHSYSGLCQYFNGKYITYSAEKPISMNPFDITEKEYNVEKKNFLKSLIFLLFKGSSGKILKEEEEILDIVIDKYYSFYFNPFSGYSKEEKESIKETLLLEYQINHNELETLREKEKRELLEIKLKKLEMLVERGEGGEVDNAKRAIQNILIENGFTLAEMNNPNERLLSIIERRIMEKEAALKDIKVDNLSFNSFYEFSLRMIPIICNENKIQFDLSGYKFLLKKFYKGGQLERTLNEKFDTSLFDEKFVVFEIDAIKDDPQLFPIVTLIIMDLFIQKMRLKKNRKALIIEEAWKAIASEMMAGYIQYLYKTVRKFWGIAMVVTQELDDIISNPIVKKSIINNSDILCLLDQKKFKDKYEEIANLLTLSEVDQKQIFTINQLNNKENRNRFNEVFIKRGSYGNVFGVEVSLYEYFTFTTERIEKDAVGYYIELYGDYHKGLDNFINDMKKSNLKTGDWVRHVASVLGKINAEQNLTDIFYNNLANEETLYKFILTQYHESA
ncbi:bacteroides conjugation system ATPase, TraG family (plasmid) [Phocaeicola salanitronis DSM 18170]|uniref:Bacteroides conjugation system ATPase, TraG family n=1 Tax=Phocaeicola salanitronis (strain DSM 18170 / JCM 13657 / CCUG 60908 / BL78) TaxID=667015 RepID=F0R952_PHOSB|nr:conjugal transfer protein TraG [Phocaeicola salanitronis]ADY38173.1 bacteroides conjugation system ATPase, TraG family [Phocaeicola salanitronis DSM 18170]